MKLRALCRQLGHEFARPELLRQALTHRSHGLPNNERLEFLGDSVLNCAIAARLYQTYPRLPEGDLSRMRAALVKEQTLAEIAFRLKLGDILMLGEGELKSGGFRRPSILADALEAIIGAVYLDAGFVAAEQMILALYEPLLQNLDPKTIAKDPKTQLQEYLQSRKLPLPQYEVLAIRGEAHEQEFEVECIIPGLNIRSLGEGHSRRSAEQNAAIAAYQAAIHE
ncbi:MAG: ribonuclease III [Sulfurimicrobium sp.]|nr:ribonuclease III [Sulfurimicrobium sp.]